MSYREFWNRDWPALARRVWGELLVDDCFGASAQLAYYFLLAFFPFIIFLAALATLLASMPPGELEVRTLQLLGEVMPQQALDLVDRTVSQILRVLQEKNMRLLVVSMLLSLWPASGGMRAIMVTLNRAYGVREGRRLWKRWLLSIVLTLVLGLSFVFTVPLLSLSSTIGDWISTAVGPGAATAWTLAGRIVPILALVVVIELIYHFAPNVRLPWRWITPGSILAVLVWLLASKGFSFYVAHFGRYEVLYAGLGAPVVLLLWFYTSGLAILVGGEMNAELERESGQRAQMAVPAPPHTDAAGHDTSLREPERQPRRHRRPRARAARRGPPHN